jgi:endonuclease I
MGFIRLVVLGFIAMTVVYFAISIYSRSVRREKLEDAWDADHPEGGDEAARDAYIENGMTEYENGFRKKLIWLVYVIPTIAVAVTLIVMNTN